MFEQVPLRDGFTTITVKSGEHADTTCFEKVKEPFAPYVLVENESESGVTNWFDSVELPTPQALTFNEGYFSIRDTLKVLMTNDEASTLLVNVVSSLMGMKIKKSMMGIMSDQTPEALTGKMPSNDGIDTKAAIAYLNGELQKIAK